MRHPLLTLAVRVQVRRISGAPPRDERGEGVISAAIAVLVMAFLGSLMWVGFHATFDKAQSKTDTQIEQIGQP
jgi:hypothetical protein